MQELNSLTNENLVKISLKSDVRNIIKYAVYLLKKKGLDYIVLSGLNQAITRVIFVAETVKVQIPGLHQINCISNMSFPDKDYLIVLPKMEITLSKIEMSRNHYGYQAPYSLEHIKLVKSVKIKKKSKNNLNKSFQLKRFSYYMKSNKLTLKGHSKLCKRDTINNSTDKKLTSSNTSIGTPISIKKSDRKVFYFKI
jgi:hypothetical protein